MKPDCTAAASNHLMLSMMTIVFAMIEAKLPPLGTSRGTILDATIHFQGGRRLIRHAVGLVALTMALWTHVHRAFKKCLCQYFTPWSESRKSRGFGECTVHCTPYPDQVPDTMVHKSTVNVHKSIIKKYVHVYLVWWHSGWDNIPEWDLAAISTQNFNLESDLAVAPENLQITLM